MIDIPDNDGQSPPIPARSKKQAMEWSLVLASQGISAIVNRTEIGWQLTVDVPEFERAKAILHQYQIENRGWNWWRQLPGDLVGFHWGSLLWVAAIVGIYYWTMVRFPNLQSLGTAENTAIRHGQWWRLFTAVTLHANVPHLASNATTGFILLGLAMARFGPGIGLLAAYLAGVAGNVAGLLIYPPNTGSLGASGMVTGALGLVSGQWLLHWRKQGSVAPFVSRGLAAGMLILVLIGFSPEADVVGHVGGFVAGATLGMALGGVRPALLQNRPGNLIAGMVLAGLVVTTWLLAVRG